jgi:LPXTG-motif cell wall-anchored protein
LAEDLLNVDGSLKDGLTQEDIDRAQESANYWDDSTKSEWQTKIDIAQELLNQRDAENAVNDLFNPDETIKDTVLQEDIDNAQDLIDKVTDVDKKQELQDKLDDAQKQLDQRDFVVLEGFKTFTGTGTVSTTIDAPVEKFSKVYVDGKLLPSSNYVITSGSTVITLNESYLKILENGTYDVEVEFVSGAKVSVPLTVDVKTITDPIDPVDPIDPIDPTDPVKPTDPTTPTNPIVTKPSVDGKPSVAGGTTVSGNNSVNTGDETNTMMLYAMLATSLLGLIVVIKRRKETE